MKILSIQMYSNKEFPKEIFSNFSLDGDPYKCEDGSPVREYLTNLGVFFYRDGLKEAKGCILQPKDMEPVEDIAGIPAFYFMLYATVKDKKLVPVTIDEYYTGVSKHDKMFTQGRVKYLKTWGAPQFWLHFNKPCFVNKVLESAVYVSK